jgi:hypothetical protein
MVAAARIGSEKVPFRWLTYGLRGQSFHHCHAGSTLLAVATLALVGLSRQTTGRPWTLARGARHTQARQQMNQTHPPPLTSSAAGPRNRASARFTVHRVCQRLRLASASVAEVRFSPSFGSMWPAMWRCQQVGRGVRPLCPGRPRSRHNPDKCTEGRGDRCNSVGSVRNGVGTRVK